MATDARVIRDSINPMGVRLTTLEVTLHRFVLAELNTHRVFSRNSASSRAIPVERQLERVVDQPAWPLSWPAEQRGMQGGDELEGDDWDDARLLFADVKAFTQTAVKRYLDAHPDKATRLHKSLINRLLEPFMWHTVIITATEWDGFWAQRCSPLAQPEIRAAAERMREVYDASEPEVVGYGAWHLPYVSADDVNEVLEETYGDEAHATEALKAISVARCARVSYLTHDGVRDVGKDLELFRRLKGADPMHASPFEHVATPCEPCGEVMVEENHEVEGDQIVRNERVFYHPHEGNLRTWRQYRHDFQPSPYHREDDE